MKNNKILLIVLFITVTTIMQSCVKEIDISMPDSQKSMVLNGFIQPDSAITVNISRSMGALEDGDVPFLENVEVSLYENNILIETLQYSQNGNYTSDKTIKENATYKIEAESQNLKNIITDCRIPDKPVIISVDTTKETKIEVYENYYNDVSYNDTNYVTIVNFDIKIDDPSGKENYYFLAISQVEEVYDYDNWDYQTNKPEFLGYQDVYTYYNGSDFIFKENYFTLNGIKGQIFTDDIFNGKEFNITVNITNYQDLKDEENHFEEKYKIALLSINKELYQYIRSYNKNAETGDNPFAQPVQVFSNIENGMGIFAGYNPVFYEFYSKPDGNMK